MRYVFLRVWITLYLLQEGHGTGRTSRGSSGSGRDGGRERTGRNIISNDSARVSHGGPSPEDAGAPIAVDGLFSSKPRRSKIGGVELGGGGYSRRKTVPEPPPYDDDDTEVTHEQQLPLPPSSLSANSRSTAPASTVPERNGGGHRAALPGAGSGVVLEDSAYLVTDTYPYTYKQLDRQDEDRLLVSTACSGSLFPDSVSANLKNTRESKLSNGSVLWVSCGGRNGVHRRVCN